MNINISKMKNNVKAILNWTGMVLVCTFGINNLSAQTANIFREAKVIVHNDGNDNINVKVVRTINYIDTAYGVSSFCFGAACFPPSTDSSSGGDVIMACSIDNTFKGEYKITDSSIFNDTCSVTYCFKDVDDPGNEQCLTFLLSGNSPASEYHEDTILFGSGCPVVSIDEFQLESTVKVYPNPASDWINIAYSLTKKDRGAWFVLRNMLGATKIKMELYGSSGKVKIPATDLNQGVYFYSLIVDDKISATKKLIIDN